LTRLLRKAAASESVASLPVNEGGKVSVQAFSQTRQLMGVVRERQRDASIDAKVRFERELVGLDMAAATLAYWMLLCQHRVETKERVLWAYPSAPDRPAAVLESLFTGLINSITGLRTLLLGGLGQPLRAVFRNQLELSIITLALAVNEPFFKDYMAWTDASEADHLKAWNKVRPKVALRVIDESLESLGFDAAARAEFSKWRTGTYAWLSGFEHGFPVAMLVSANAWDEDGDIGSSVGGTVDNSIAAVASHITWGLYEFISLLTSALHRTHGWRGRGSELSAEILLTTKFFQSYMHEMMAEQDREGAER
jgi:hypothetical protein